jgi:hypothetical protein
MNRPQHFGKRRIKKTTPQGSQIPNLKSQISIESGPRSTGVFPCWSRMLGSVARVLMELLGAPRAFKGMALTGHARHRNHPDPHEYQFHRAHPYPILPETQALDAGQGECRQKVGVS